jgi:hypothetical protein
MQINVSCGVDKKSKQITEGDIMKQFVLLLAVTLGLLGLTTGNLQAASPNTKAVLITIQISGIIQQTTIVTNGDVVTTTYTTTPVKLGNQNILNLLQAEFGTTFPVGAQLAYNLSGTRGFHVLDQSGNPILDASTNAADSSYVFDLSNDVASATVPTLIIGKAVDNTVTSNQTQIVSQVVPDYGIFYSDSHGNNFHLDGLLTLKANGSVTSSNTTYNTVSFTIAGSGGGTFFNPADDKYDTGVFTKVKVSAKGAGIIQ